MGETDLISRQAAVDVLEERLQANGCSNVALVSELNRSIGYLRQLPAVQRCADCENLSKTQLLIPQPEQKWIPVSERLPEVHESGNSFFGIYMQSVPVLVYGICEGEENAQFHVVTYCDDLDGNTYWSTELDALTITEVIAWMPLPEPYAPSN